MATQRRCGFTLVELLVVITIIGILMGLLMPAVQNAREAGRKLSCANNVKQLAAGCLSHESQVGFLPSGGWGNQWVGDADAGYGRLQPGGWCYNIMPFIDLKNIHDYAAGSGGSNALLAYTSTTKKNKNADMVVMISNLFYCPTRRTARALPVATSVVLNNVTIPTPFYAPRTDYAGNSGCFWNGTYACSTAGPTAATVNATPASTMDDVGWSGFNYNYKTYFSSSATQTGGMRVDYRTDGVIYQVSQVRMGEIRDGASNTYLLGEKFVTPENYNTGTDGGDSRPLTLGTYADNCRHTSLMTGTNFNSGWINVDNPDPNFTLSSVTPGIDPTGVQCSLVPVIDTPSGLQPSGNNYQWRFGSPHPAGMNMAFCDGSVKTINYNIDPKVNACLGSRRDGQPISDTSAIHSTTMPGPLFPTSRLEIAGLSVAELARRFGTPTFVYDAARIVQRLRDLAAFDVVRYAQKACSNLAILDLLRRHGALVDTVSAGEIHRALAAGYTVEGSPPPIVYTADIFDAPALELCVQRGIHVNCGSSDMLGQLGVRAPGRAITLRINPGFGHGHSQKTNTGGKQSKHGIWHEDLAAVLRLADCHGLKVTGLHVHIGSGTDLEHLSQVCVALEAAAVRVGTSIASISVGGGLPVPYREDQAYVDLEAYFALCNAARKRLEDRFGHRLSLEIEPGRYLVAESGFLVTEIRAVKRQAENIFYLVNAGFNNLARPILYGAYHPLSIAPADGRQRPEQAVIVGGPLCESGDIFTQEEGGFVAARRLPEASVGDLLVVECAGAYGFVMGSNYNSKPLAAEVLLRDGQAHLVRCRQTVEDLIRGESIPPLT